MLICKQVSWKTDLRFTDTIGINGNIAASFSAMVPNCLSAGARLIVGVFFSGDFSDWKSIRNTTMININIGPNITPLPQFEVKGKLECRIKPLICYLHLIWSVVSKVKLKGNGITQACEQLIMLDRKQFGPRRSMLEDCHFLSLSIVFWILTPVNSLFIPFRG